MSSLVMLTDAKHWNQIVTHRYNHFKLHRACPYKQCTGMLAGSFPEKHDEHYCFFHTIYVQEGAVTKKIALKYLSFCLFVIFVSCPIPIAKAYSQPDYWPTNGWRTSTLEEQGIEPTLVTEMLERIITDGVDIDSISIVRNGYLVADIYMYPSDKDKKHPIHSCTKSFTSTLIGIALDKGYIKSVEQPMINFFPEKSIKNMDGLKRSVTLENLLTMSSGLETKDNPKIHGLYGLIEMRATNDWTQYVLDRPMSEQPGSRFEYGNLVSFLLTSILQKQTVVDDIDFAHTYLFGPLGIENIKWSKSPNGIYTGYGDMWLTPHDMLKLGLLYLNSGLWENKQLLSKTWVEKATRGHIAVGPSLQYGYHWWVTDDFYFAMGYEGQFLFVVPNKNMVVVFTSSLMGPSLWTPYDYLEKFILPAAKSIEAISVDLVNSQRVGELTRDLQKKYYHEIQVSNRVR